LRNSSRYRDCHAAATHVAHQPAPDCSDSSSQRRDRELSLSAHAVVSYGSAQDDAQNRCPAFFAEKTMNRDIIEGNWKMAKGKVKTQWAKLTDDELDEIKGNYEQLCGRIQKAYGISRDQVEIDISRLS
jgi:uncharacterized protein YjbJ (UPF0337 family)